MPTMTIFTDNQPVSAFGYNLFSAGHFYVRLEGPGLDQGVFAPYAHDANGNGIPDVTIGFYDTGLRDDNSRAITNASAPGVLQKSYDVTSLTDAEFATVTTALSSWISNTPTYVIASDNCADFANAMYSATGRGTNFANALIPPADLTALDSGAARYVAVKYFGDVADVQFYTAFAAAMYYTNDVQILHQVGDFLTNNPQLSKYGITDELGQ